MSVDSLVPSFAFKLLVPMRIENKIALQRRVNMYGEFDYILYPSTHCPDVRIKSSMMIVPVQK